MRIAPLRFAASNNDERRPSPENVRRLLRHVSDLNATSRRQVIEAFKFVPQSPYTAIVSGTRSSKEDGQNWVFSLATKMMFPANKRGELRTEPDGTVLYVDSLRVEPGKNRVLAREPLVPNQIVPRSYRRFSVDQILDKYFDLLQLK